VWASIHVKQDLRNEEAENLFYSKVGVWVYPTFSYIRDEKTLDPANSFGIEINDGSHVLWFIFSDKNVGTYTLNGHRIVVIDTPLNQWSYREINIAAEYIDEGWSKPKSFTFMLIIGLTQAVEGERVGFFREITVELPSTSYFVDTSRKMLFCDVQRCKVNTVFLTGKLN